MKNTNRTRTRNNNINSGLRDAMLRAHNTTQHSDVLGHYFRFHQTKQNTPPTPVAKAEVEIRAEARATLPATIRFVPSPVVRLKGN